MPPRKTPTGRQRRIGAELRRMREHAGLSIAEAAARLGTDRTNVSSLESGRFGVSAERVHTLASHYECPDAGLIDGLAKMAEVRVRGWWEDYRSLLSAAALDLAELEFHAARISSVQVVHIPGLLQTEEHARALFRCAVPAPSDVELQRRLSHRMKRKVIFERDQPTPCSFVLHEAALRMQMTRRDIHLRQLDRLLEASEQRNLTLRVIAFSAGGYTGLGTGFTFAEGSVPALSTVQVDNAHGALFLDAESHLLNYRAVLERVDAVSMSPRESRSFIRKVARDL